MNEPRFIVGTVYGFPSMNLGGSNKFGVSAHVMDTLNLYEVVHTIRSHTKRGTQEERIARALRQAEAECARLNEWDREEAARGLVA